MGLIHAFDQPLEKGEILMPRSRWDSIEGYLGTTKYNDKEEPYNREVYEELRKDGQFAVSGFCRNVLLPIPEIIHNASQ